MLPTVLSDHPSLINFPIHWPAPPVVIVALEFRNLGCGRIFRDSPGERLYARFYAWKKAFLSKFLLFFPVLLTLRKKVVFLSCLFTLTLVISWRKVRFRVTDSSPLLRNHAFTIISWCSWTRKQSMAAWVSRTIAFQVAATSAVAVSSTVSSALQWTSDCKDFQDFCKKSVIVLTSGMDIASS